MLKYFQRYFDAYARQIKKIAPLKFIIYKVIVNVKKQQLFHL
jgi:hypothetical protein